MSVSLVELLSHEHSCVTLKRCKKHIALYPSALSNSKHAVRTHLNKLLTKYDPEVNGVILGFQNVKTVSRHKPIFEDIPHVLVDVEADFYVFRPEVGSTLSGIVKKKNEDCIVCLVHDKFNVTIPIDSENTRNGINFEDIYLGQEIIFTVEFVDFTNSLPYIRGRLESVEGLSSSLSLDSVTNMGHKKAKKRKSRPESSSSVAKISNKGSDWEHDPGDMEMHNLEETNEEHTHSAQYATPKGLTSILKKRNTTICEATPPKRISFYGDEQSSPPAVRADLSDVSPKKKRKKELHNILSPQTEGGPDVIQEDIQTSMNINENKKNKDASSTSDNIRRQEMKKNKKKEKLNKILSEDQDNINTYKESEGKRMEGERDVTESFDVPLLDKGEVKEKKRKKKKSTNSEETVESRNTGNWDTVDTVIEQKTKVKSSSKVHDRNSMQRIEESVNGDFQVRDNNEIICQGPDDDHPIIVRKKKRKREGTDYAGQTVELLHEVSVNTSPKKDFVAEINELNEEISSDKSSFKDNISVKERKKRKQKHMKNVDNMQLDRDVIDEEIGSLTNIQTYPPEKKPKVRGVGDKSQVSQSEISSKTSCFKDNTLVKEKKKKKQKHVKNVDNLQVDSDFVDGEIGSPTSIQTYPSQKKPKVRGVSDKSHISQNEEISSETSCFKDNTLVKQKKKKKQKHVKNADNLHVDSDLVAGEIGSPTSIQTYPFEKKPKVRGVSDKSHISQNEEISSETSCFKDNTLVKQKKKKKQKHVKNADNMLVDRDLIDGEDRSPTNIQTYLPEKKPKSRGVSDKLHVSQNLVQIKRSKKQKKKDECVETSECSDGDKKKLVLQKKNNDLISHHLKKTPSANSTVISEQPPICNRKPPSPSFLSNSSFESLSPIKKSYEMGEVSEPGIVTSTQIVAGDSSTLVQKEKKKNQTPIPHNVYAGSHASRGNIERKSKHKSQTRTTSGLDISEDCLNSNDTDCLKSVVDAREINKFKEKTATSEKKHMPKISDEVCADNRLLLSKVTHKGESELDSSDSDLPSTFKEKLKNPTGTGKVDPSIIDPKRKSLGDEDLTSPSAEENVGVQGSSETDSSDSHLLALKNDKLSKKAANSKKKHLPTISSELSADKRLVVSKVASVPEEESEFDSSDSDLPSNFKEKYKKPTLTGGVAPSILDPKTKSLSITEITSPSAEKEENVGVRGSGESDSSDSHAVVLKNDKLNKKTALAAAEKKHVPEISGKVSADKRLISSKLASVPEEESEFESSDSDLPSNLKEMYKNLSATGKVVPSILDLQKKSLGDTEITSPSAAKEQNVGVRGSRESDSSDAHAVALKNDKLNKKAANSEMKHLPEISGKVSATSVPEEESEFESSDSDLPSNLKEMYKNLSVTGKVVPSILDLQKKSLGDTKITSPSAAKEQNVGVTGSRESDSSDAHAVALKNDKLNKKAANSEMKHLPEISGKVSATSVPEEESEFESSDSDLPSNLKEMYKNLSVTGKVVPSILDLQKKFLGDTEIASPSAGKKENVGIRGSRESDGSDAHAVALKNDKLNKKAANSEMKHLPEISGKVSVTSVPEEESEFDSSDSDLPSNYKEKYKKPTQTREVAPSILNLKKKSLGVKEIIPPSAEKEGNVGVRGSSGTDSSDSHAGPLKTDILNLPKISGEVSADKRLDMGKVASVPEEGSEFDSSDSDLPSNFKEKYKNPSVTGEVLPSVGDKIKSFDDKGITEHAGRIAEKLKLDTITLEAGSLLPVSHKKKLKKGKKVSSRDQGTKCAEGVLENQDLGTGVSQGNSKKSISKKEKTKRAKKTSYSDTGAKSAEDLLEKLKLEGLLSQGASSQSIPRKEKTKRSRKNSRSSHESTENTAEIPEGASSKSTFQKQKNEAERNSSLRELLTENTVNAAKSTEGKKNEFLEIDAKAEIPATISSKHKSKKEKKNQNDPELLHKKVKGSTSITTIMEKLLNAKLSALKVPSNNIQKEKRKDSIPAKKSKSNIDSLPKLSKNVEDEIKLLKVNSVQNSGKDTSVKSDQIDLSKLDLSSLSNELLKNL